MKFADPLAITCPSCASQSRHNAKDLVAIAAVCPICGFSLEEAGKQLRKFVDETSTFYIWAEMLMYVEDRLGIASPGIPDHQTLDSRPVSELTLRDLMYLVSNYAVTEGETVNRLVMEAAREVIGHQLSETDVDRPICSILGNLRTHLRRPSEVPPL